MEKLRITQNPIPVIVKEIRNGVVYREFNLEIIEPSDGEFLSVLLRDSSSSTNSISTVSIQSTRLSQEAARRVLSLHLGENCFGIIHLFFMMYPESNQVTLFTSIIGSSTLKSKSQLHNRENSSRSKVKSSVTSLYNRLRIDS